MLFYTRGLVLGVAVVLAGCGSSSSGPPLGSSNVATSFKVGGQIGGLTSGSVVVQLNGANNLTLTGNGQFTFAPSLNTGTAYTATILTPPASPQQCSINNASGTIADQAIHSVTITCGCDIPAGPTVDVTGKITFDHVPHNTSTSGLDYASTTQSPARGVNVQAISSGGALITCANTDASGNYTLTVPQGTDMTVRVFAEMVKQGTPSWTYRVVDNTASNAQWAIQSALFNSGASNITGKDLNAASGWGTTSYTATRAAAPFAILDDVYTAITLIQGPAPNTAFPGLTLNWSPSNIPSTGTVAVSTGHIGTTHYNNSNIYILGAANVDTDEYDDHVIIHEFGHYFEDLFSRADSLGGSHSSGDRLDMRVAFSEGWGNAFSGMATNDQYYRDASGNQQLAGFSIDLESNNSGALNNGWFSEDSVQSILYDLYDSANDNPDTLSLGFTPIYNVLTNQQRTTSAFTSLFSFITALKDDYVSDMATLNTINSIVGNQSVFSSTINTYGTTETNSGGLGSNALPVYTSVAIGGSVSNLCTTNFYGTPNKLGNWRYLRLQIAGSGSHTVSISGDSQSDPDMYVYKNGRLVAFAENVGNTDSLQYGFSAGEYLIDVDDYNLLINSRSGTSCFTISVSN